MIFLKIVLLMIFSIGCSTSEITATDPDTANSNTLNQNDLPESERKMIYVKIMQAKDTAEFEEMSGGGNATILFNTAKRRIASEHQITVMKLESIEREGRDNNWITM